MHLLRVAATLHQPLEAAEVRLHHFLVPFEREDQRDVDVLAEGDHLLDRPEAGLGRRNLHVEVGLVDPVVQALGLRDRAVAVVGERRVDLPRHVTVETLSLVPDLPQQVARIRDVVRGELQEDLLRIFLARLEDLSELFVVGVAFSNRLLEDRRIGSDADDRVLFHHPRELSALQQLTREVVDPDALAERRQLVQVRVRHGRHSFQCLRSSAVVSHNARRRRTVPRERS